MAGSNRSAQMGHLLRGISSDDELAHIMKNTATAGNLGYLLLRVSLTAL